MNVHAFRQPADHLPPADNDPGRRIDPARLAEANPDWKLDLNDEVIGIWRGELGNSADMTLVWGAPLIPGGTLVTVVASGERAADERTRAAFFIVEPSRSELEEIAWLIDSGALRPIVGSVFLLAEARKAYEQRPAAGKAVLKVVSAG